ncbi:MAG: ribonuclease J [Candidatus Levybacteria bacterium]|nr:ribonuclease J [Candidatus Levybacteria bacterium]MBP9814822.1 ribonuclease J [Candidatus Levybacteria bacterium]
MNEITFISIGGIGDVTKNMYAYIYGDEILLVDCGIGFADSNLPGVDLLIPDISYIKEAIKSGKKIVGLLLSHGHEDHIGALPFILPQLPQFPVYGSTLTAALANDKLSEFGIDRRVTEIQFSDPALKLGVFSASFIRMTHSIIDASNILIGTPIGNFYHGSDFKFDFTPVDGNLSEVNKIASAGDSGILCLMSDCLGAEKHGHSRSEQKIKDSFELAFRETKGKVFVTTYSSNISRLNQAIEVAISQGRKVCFMGRSLLKTRDVGRSLNYMKFPKKFEIRPHEVAKYKPSEVMILVAGSQAQESSALSRITNNDDRDLRIEKGDTVIFSADPIPGNEENIYALVDNLSRRGARVIYSEITDEFHVSGHGSENDLKLLISLTHPRYFVPIGGTFRQMAAYREIVKAMGYRDNSAFLIDSGQELHFSKEGVRLGRKVSNATIFVDQMTGEEVENYIVIDRVRIAKEGIIIIMVELEGSTGQIISNPEILTKGFVYEKKEEFAKTLGDALAHRFANKKDPVSSVGYYKKVIEKAAEEILYREGRSPLVVPVIIEV